MSTNLIPEAATRINAAATARITTLAKKGVPLAAISTIMSLEMAQLVAHMQSLPAPFEEFDVSVHPEVETLFDYHSLVTVTREVVDTHHTDRARSVLNRVLNTIEEAVDAGQNHSLKSLVDAATAMHRIAKDRDDLGRPNKTQTAQPTGMQPGGNTVYVDLSGLLPRRSHSAGAGRDGDSLSHCVINSAPRPVLNADAQVIGIQEGDDITSLDSMSPETLRALANRGAGGQVAVTAEAKRQRLVSLRESLKTQAVVNASARMGDDSSVFVDIDVFEVDE